MRLRISVCCLLLLSLLSCVKENRSSCPCILDVTVSGGVETLVTLSLWDSGLRQSDTIDIAGGECRHECEISRGHFIMTASSGIRHTPDSRGNLLLGEGEEMDELYSYSGNLDADAEVTSSSVLLHKQFATIEISVLCTDISSLPDGIVLTGDCAGVNLVSLSPVKGTFVRRLYPVLGEYCRVSVPRQCDESLLLSIPDFGDIHLGQLIAETGYDWTAEDLEDISIEIDLVECRISIGIGDWIIEKEFDVVI